MRSGRRKEKSILTRFIVSVGIVLAISVAVIAAFLWWYTARTLDQYHDSLLQQCQLAAFDTVSDTLPRNGFLLSDFGKRKIGIIIEIHNLVLLLGQKHFPVHIQQD